MEEAIITKELPSKLGRERRAWLVSVSMDVMVSEVRRADRCGCCSEV